MNRRKFLLASSGLVLLYAGFLFYSYSRGAWPVRREEHYRFEFAAPVLYKGEVLIRNDSMGLGHFGASRSRGARSHAGIDIYAPEGTAVKAAERGLAETGNSPRGYGLLVRIDHGNGYYTLYAHLSEILVEDEDFVEKGQVIGRVGKTGNAGHALIEPHLHFEIRKDGMPVDPAGYLEISEARVNGE